jgi:hypothetical protein
MIPENQRRDLLLFGKLMTGEDRLNELVKAARVILLIRGGTG